MMQRITFCFATLLLIGLATLPAVTAQKNDKAETLLQAAQHKQLVEGDLKGALQLYQQIIAQHGNNRAAAAKALVQMGKCYEKQGLAQARKAYDQVVRDYGDQREMVAEARLRLSALRPPASNVAASKVAISPMIRQAWAGPDVDISGGLAPDGRFLSFTDWETGDLAILNLITGEKRRLTKNNSPFSLSSSEYADTSRPSPDGKRIAYSWFNRDKVYELRVINIDGSDPRTIYSLKADYVNYFTWSTDGKYILFNASTKNNEQVLTLLSIADGSTRVLKTFDRNYPWGLSFSPDNRYIAYSWGPKSDSMQHDIFLLPVAGGQEIPLVTHPAVDGVVGWTPDGKYLLFGSDRTGIMGLWRIQVADGKPQGMPELIKRDIAMSGSIGITRDGALYYAISKRATEVYTAALDSKTGKLVSSLSPVAPRYLGTNLYPDWSPDGRSLAYVSYRGPFPNAPGDVLCIMSNETGQVREFTPPLAKFGSPHWSPDGRFILVYRGPNSSNRQGLHKIDSQTGETTLLAESEREPRISPLGWTADGRGIIYVIGSESSVQVRQLEIAGASASVISRELNPRQEKEILRLEPIGQIRLALASDGRLAVLSKNKLKAVGADGREERELLTLKESELIDKVAWSRDGRQIYFAKRQGSRSEVWRVASAGGEPQNTGLVLEGLSQLSIHPDGQRIAFSTAEKMQHEIWVIENFLPSTQNKKSSASRR
jgi:Tol biopolymer transport system component